MSNWTFSLGWMTLREGFLPMNVMILFINCSVYLLVLCICYGSILLHPWFKFSFLLGFKLSITRYCTPNHRKIKFKPRIPESLFLCTNGQNAFVFWTNLAVIVLHCRIKHVNCVIQIVVLWTSDAPIAHNNRWPQISIPLMVVRPESKVWLEVFRLDIARTGKQ